MAGWTPEEAAALTKCPRCDDPGILFNPHRDAAPNVIEAVVCRCGWCWFADARLAKAVSKCPHCVNGEPLAVLHKVGADEYVKCTCGMTWIRKTQAGETKAADGKGGPRLYRLQADITFEADDIFDAIGKLSLHFAARLHERAGKTIQFSGKIDVSPAPPLAGSEHYDEG